MIVVGLDFETTFSDPVDGKVARMIETGAVLWDTERAYPLRILNQVSHWLPEFGEFDPRITALTGLTQNDLDTHGRPPASIFENLIGFMGMAEAIVAHNGNGFDRPVLENELIRHSMGSKIPTLPWYDTSCDVPYPAHMETRKLAFLAPSHGFLNPFSHRAVFDVLSMLKVMSFYDIEEIKRRATSPKVTLRAFTQKPWEDGGRSNQLAKDRGFRFNGDNKLWTKIVLADEVDAEVAKGPLKVGVLE